MDILFILSSKGFGLSPLMLDGIEIRRIRGEVQKIMSCLFKGIFHCFPFVKSGIVQNDNTPLRKLGNEILDHPMIKDLCVDGRVK